MLHGSIEYIPGLIQKHEPEVLYCVSCLNSNDTSAVSTLQIVLFRSKIGVIDLYVLQLIADSDRNLPGPM